MFKFAKYYLLLNLYRRHRRTLLNVLASIIAIPLVSLVFSDLSGMTEGQERYLLVGVKWLLIFSLLGIIRFQLKKLSLPRSIPFEKSTSAQHTNSVKKEKIMTKTKLKSRMDIIVEKYRRTA